MLILAQQFLMLSLPPLNDEVVRAVKVTLPDGSTTALFSNSTFNGVPTMLTTQTCFGQNRAIHKRMSKEEIWRVFKMIWLPNLISILSETIQVTDALDHITKQLRFDG
jgi:hypothetical protein